ncbi:MAG: DUF4340 domain-containing protein [Chloroflexi bacterium]|nr:DUF4340 domain-containing protein [Chloroflexota bacterium]
MLKQQVGYSLLVGLAAVLIALLMLDDPAEQQALFMQVRATQQNQQLIVIFPELRSSTQIYGIEVLDVATGQDVLLMRDDQGLWYAPEMPDGQAEIPALQIDQPFVESAVLAINLLAAEQQYEFEPDDRSSFGLEPPAYRIRFVARDSAGVSYAPVILEVGDANPNDTAYYVWPQGGTHLYLIPKPTIDSLLRMLSEPVQALPTPASSALKSEVTALLL